MKKHTPHGNSVIDPEIKKLLNDGQQLKILNYRKPFNEYILGRFIGRENDIREIDSYFTPIEKWFVHNHFDVLRLEIKEWSLKLEGLFEKRVSLKLDELKKFKRVSLDVTVECNGNSAPTGEVIKKVSIFRLIYKGFHYLNPLKWSELYSFLHRGALVGFFSTARFTGVKLLDLLEEYPLKDEVDELIFHGMDNGYDSVSDILTGNKKYYERSVPLSEIKKSDPILCFEMNGKPLLPTHGYPLRIIFPGIMGADHVKWLNKISAIKGSFNGHFMANYYRNFKEVNENGVKVKQSFPARIQKIKSAIIKLLKKGEFINVIGVAWSGNHSVKEVLVSNDGGRNWMTASLLHDPAPFRWVFWRCCFKDCKKGKTTFISRAVDSEGNRQPMEREENIFYGNNAILPATVIIP